MALDRLQDAPLTAAEPFDAQKHINRTTPNLTPIAEGALPLRLVDRFGRQKTYLRLSVTDRCNLACTYCVPSEGVPLYERDEFLTLDHLKRMAAIGARLGINKLRVTGGEPTLRPGLSTFIRDLTSIPGIEQVTMTTNGVLLRRLAEDLASAGIHSLNISIDSINPERFRQITRGGELATVLEGIDAALACGIKVKLNTVALNDFTLPEAIDIIEFARPRGLEARFIEFMPLCGTGWKPDAFRPLTGLMDALEERYSFTPLHNEGGVADRFQLDESEAVVGFIASLSNNFCAACSRVRFTATGMLRPCLFSSVGVDFRPLLLNDRSDDELIRAYHHAVLNKPEGHGLDPTNHWEGSERVDSWIRSTGG